MRNRNPDHLCLPLDVPFLRVIASLFITLIFRTFFCSQPADHNGSSHKLYHILLLGATVDERMREVRNQLDHNMLSTPLVYN